MRSLHLGVLVVTLLLAGCGAGSGASTGSGSEPTSSSPLPSTSATTPSPPTGGAVPDLAANLRIVVRADGTTQTSTHTLTCVPTGGDLADPQAACDQLNDLGQEAFADPPEGTMCTQQYGGPQTATITGTLGGEPIKASFSRTDGCQISRWESLSALLGPGGN